ncbi:MAG: hypothetical protein V4475_15510 [Pseudomonadota bacterium]
MPTFAQNFSNYAQSSFEVLCDVANVTKNPSIQDREGWDYIVEFARARIPRLPHDRQPGNATVRVQVKSKTDGKPTASIKLSNALRFANEPDPCFIALWWRNADHSEERIYARHFDEPLIEATLRRAREAQRDGKKDLNRLRLSITFEESNDHTDDLIAWIQSIGDTDQHDYANRKRQLASELGFEAGRIGGTVKLPFDDVQKLIDAAVGLPTSPADVEITFGDKRFDIVSPIFEGKPSVFNLNAIPRPGQLTFQNASGRAATFTGEVRKFAMDNLPLETVRATFKSPGMSGILRGPEFNISYHFSGEDVHPLDRLQNLARFMVISEERCSVALTLDQKDEPLETTCPKVAIEDREIFAWLDDALRCLRSCCGPDDNPPLRAADVFAAHDEIVNFAIAGAPGTPTFDFETDSDVGLPLVSSLVGYRLLQIGGVSFYAIFRRACLEQSVLDRKIHLRFNDAVELEAGALAMDDKPARAIVEQRFGTLAARVGKGALILNHGDYLSVMRKEGPSIEVL